MELIWKQLLTVMETMCQRSRGLAELARRQREAVAHEQIREVGEIVIAQERELQAFQELEQEREALVRAVCEDLKLAPEKLDAARLLELVPAAWSNTYRQQVEQLRRAVDEVKREHEVNRRMLQRSQEFVTWLLNYLVTPEGSTPVYDAAGVQVQRSYYHFVNQML